MERLTGKLQCGQETLPRMPTLSSLTAVRGVHWIKSIPMGWVAIPLAMAALIPMLIPGLALWFQWERGDPWNLIRWIGCHWTHWSWSHLLWDAVVFTALGAWVQRISLRGLLWTLALAAFAIPLVIGWLLPEISSYRGLSGLDSALFGFLTTRLGWEALRNKRRGDAVVVGIFLLGFVLKTLYEMKLSQSIFVGDAGGMVPVPLAHAVGVGVGLGVAILGLPQKIQFDINSQ